MAPESFYVISTRWVRIMLDLPLGDRFLGRFSWTPPQGAVLVEERHRGPRIAHEASIHVVAWRGRCCANTRSDKWHPLLAIGIQCCVYLRDCRDWRLDPGVRTRPTEILAELLLGQEQGAARAQQRRVRRLRRVPLPRLAADREPELERRPLHAAA